MKAGLPDRQLDTDCSDQDMLWIIITEPQGTQISVCAVYRPGSCADNKRGLTNNTLVGQASGFCASVSFQQTWDGGQEILIGAE